MLPDISISSYMSGGENNGTPNYVSEVWEWRADYQQNIGRHTLFAGADFNTNNQGAAASVGGSLGFSPFQTSNGSNGGDALASFLMGLPTSAEKNDILNEEHGGWVNGVYVQDQWRARDNLTVNLGFRYDVSLIPIIQSKKFGAYNDILDYYNGTDIIQNLPPPCSSTRFAPCIPGGSLPAHVVVSNQPGKLYFADMNNYQPRIGLSYAFRATTVFHFGYGRVYDNWAAVDQSAQNVHGWLMQDFEQLQNLNTTPGLPNPVKAEDPLKGYTGSLPNPTPFSGVGWNTGPQFVNPYADEWTVGVQQQLASNTVWSINYMGSLGRHLDYTPVANTAKHPGPGAVAPRTPYPYMQQSFFDEPIGRSEYNALETSLHGRSRKLGLTYIASYTWSKNLNYGGDLWYGSGGGLTQSIENPYNFKNDRSVTGSDLPQVFNLAWVWQLPVGSQGLSTGTKIGNYLLGNWRLSGILSLSSGMPYTVTDSGDIANTGNFSTYERPNQVGNPHLSNPTPQKWINTSAFVAPQAYTFGNTPRNSLRTEASKNLDLSLARMFPIGRRFHFNLRVDAFNALNHPTWGFPQNCQNCTNFGVVSSTSSTARQVQLSGALTF